jgi:hypothetical protein
MSAPEQNPASDAHCLVCGKSVEGGGGFCRLKVGDSMIALCCPLCLETFQANPKSYAAKAALQQSGLLDGERFHL